MTEWLLLDVVLLLFFILFPVHFAVLLFVFSFRRNDLLKGNNMTFFPSVTLLIPAYDEEKVIERTLRSISDLNYPKEKLEVIVIAGGSTDRTIEICKQYEGLGYIKVNTETSCVIGKPAALNIGLKQANNEIVAIYDADCYLPKDSLASLLQPLVDKEIVASMGPVYLLNEDTNVLTRGLSLEYLWNYGLLNFIRSKTGLAMLIPGRNWCIRKAILEQTGGFDELSLTEDNNMTWRLYTHGFRMAYAPSAVILEEAPESWGTLLRQRRRWAAGGIREIKRFIPSISLREAIGFPLLVIEATLPIWIMISLLGIPVSLTFSLASILLFSCLTATFGFCLLLFSANVYRAHYRHLLLYLPIYAAIMCTMVVVAPVTLFFKKRKEHWPKTPKSGISTKTVQTDH